MQLVACYRHQNSSCNNDASHYIALITSVKKSLPKCMWHKVG